MAGSGGEGGSQIARAGGGQQSLSEEEKLVTVTSTGIGKLP
jgi:hypothetical protein